MPHPCQDRCVTKHLTVAIPAAMAIASYRHGATGLEYRPSRRPLVDGYGRSAHYHGSEGPRLAHERAAVGCSHEVTRPVAQLLDARGGHAIVWFGKGIAEALSSR